MAITIPFLTKLLLALHIGERLVRLWGNFKRIAGRKKEQDEKQNGNAPDSSDDQRLHS